MSKVLETLKVVKSYTTDNIIENIKLVQSMWEIEKKMCAIVRSKHHQSHSNFRTWRFSQMCSTQHSVVSECRIA